MCRHFETLRVEHGKIAHVMYHDMRMNQTYKMLWEKENPISISDLSLGNLPWGRHKLRVVYDRQGIVQTSLTPYIPRNIKTLKVVDGSAIAYPYKAEDRTVLERMYALRSGCDEVLIVKNGVFTDTSFSNVAFFDGTHWLTPRLPLLYGTARARLLVSGVLEEADITLDMLSRFSKVCLINALLHWRECEVSVYSIK